MRCPVDKEPLLVLEYDDVEVDYCGTCHGLWLDAGELGLLLGDVGIAAHVLEAGALAPREAVRRCPACRAKMDKRTTAAPHAITYDVCPRGHGLWFDAGELNIALGAEPNHPAARALTVWLGEAFAKASSRATTPDSTP